MGVLQPGGTVVDASRNLVITVDSQIQADPLAYRVRVQWNQPIPDNPDGAFDLTITPWDLTTYETPDIWIDSTRRNRRRRLRVQRRRSHPARSSAATAPG